jgi:hypothetical protein
LCLCTFVPIPTTLFSILLMKSFQEISIDTSPFFTKMG